MEEWKSGRLEEGEFGSVDKTFQPSNLPTLQPSNLPTFQLPIAIGLFLFSIYLLSFSGKFHVMDELAVFSAGHNLAQYQRADINQLIWTNHWTPNPPGIWGSDDNLYTKKPPGISFITAPLIWLGHALPGLDAVHAGLLTNAIVTALTASILYLWLTDLGFAYTSAALAGLGYGLCTIAWVYARMFWESSLLALFFLVAAWAAYRATHPAQSSRQWPWLFLCGLAVAISLTLRFEAAIALGLIGLYLITPQVFRLPSATPNVQDVTRNSAKPPPGTLHAPRSTLFLAPSLLLGLGLLYFNYIRYGSIVETGYSQEILFREPWVGTFGLLFSPGRGLFIYSPLLLLFFLGIRPAWQRLPRPYFWLISALCLCYWLFYGSWFAWGGAWGWGPRFLLPILPLLMLFVAEVIEAAGSRGEEEAIVGPGMLPPGPHPPPFTPARSLPSEPPTQYAIVRSLPLGRPTPHALRLTLYALTTLSLLVNLLGILVDFNEHFLRLGSANDNFVFNWAVFPPLAHWQILQEGLVDLIWLRPSSTGLHIEWAILLPALTLFVLATANLVINYLSQKEIRNKKLEILYNTQYAIRNTQYALIFILLALLTYLILRGTAQTALATEQAGFDQPVLDTLATSARPGDVLLMPMPPFGDVQEITTRLMAYVDRPLPTYAWIESDPRAIESAERKRVGQAVRTEGSRAWLFERWLTQGDPPTVTATWLNQEAFPVQEQWFAQSGRLTLYALSDESRPIPTPANIPFQGGLTLLDFTILGDKPEPGEVLKLRLTWQAEEGATIQGLPPDSLIVFVQLLEEVNGQRVAQNDRLLVDLQNFKQSPLLPGQTLRQGYGLQLPADLTPGAYALVAGLYQAGSGQRLPRADGSPDDFLYLTTVQFKP